MALKTLEVRFSDGSGPEVVASVIICGYRSGERIGAAIDSLRRQNIGQPFEVIAVISADKACERYLSTHHPDVRVLGFVERVPPGRARNLGIEASRGPFVAFIPDDGIAAPEWLRERAILHEAGANLVAGAIANGTPRSLIGTACYYVEYTASMPIIEVLRRQPIPHTLSYSRTIFDRVGFFPEPTTPGEDTVFNRRCLEAGLEVAFAPRAAIAHVNLTRFGDYLEHQRQHGRGLMDRILENQLEGPFALDGGLIRREISFISYPLRRWRSTWRLIRIAGGAHAARFLICTPLVIAGYLSGVLGSWEALRGAPPPDVQ